MLLSAHAGLAVRALKLIPVCFGPLDDPDEHWAHGGQPAAAVCATHRLLHLLASERCLPPQTRVGGVELLPSPSPPAPL